MGDVNARRSRGGGVVPTWMLTCILLGVVLGTSLVYTDVLALHWIWWREGSVALGKVGKVGNVGLKETAIIECRGKMVKRNACSVIPDEDKVNSIIQAGYDRETARLSLLALGNDEKASCCHEHIMWIKEHHLKKRGGEEAIKQAAAERCPDSAFPSCCNLHPETDMDGFAVRWGIDHLTATAEECCDACRAYEPVGPHFYECNVWVWCGESECFSPSAHTYEFGQCWLKFQQSPDNPQINMQGKLSDEYRNIHPTAPERVHWTSGVILNRGQTLKNGTWSPRAEW